MSYSVHQQTQIEGLLTSVKEDLWLTNTSQYDFHLKNILKRLARSICTLDNTIQTIETVEICDASALLPCNFVEFNKGGGILFGNLDCDNEYANRWISPVYTGGAFFKNVNRFNDWPCFASAQVVGERIWFNDNIDYTEVHLSFNGLRMNPDGTPFIPLRYERPLIAGACWQFIRASKHKTGHTNDQMMDFKLEWVNGKAWVEANAKLPDALQMQAIIRIWNRWV